MTVVVTFAVLIVVIAIPVQRIRMVFQLAPERTATSPQHLNAQAACLRLRLRQLQPRRTKLPRPNKSVPVPTRQACQVPSCQRSARGILESIRRSAKYER